jgi:hypothetical protein
MALTPGRRLRILRGRYAGQVVTLVKANRRRLRIMCKDGFGGWVLRRDYIKASKPSRGEVRRLVAFVNHRPRTRAFHAVCNDRVSRLFDGYEDENVVMFILNRTL